MPNAVPFGVSLDSVLTFAALPVRPSFRDLGRATGLAPGSKFQRHALGRLGLRLSSLDAPVDRIGVLLLTKGRSLGVLYRSNPHLCRLWRGLHPLCRRPGVLHAEGVRIRSQAVPIVPSLASVDARDEWL